MIDLDIFISLSVILFMVSMAIHIMNNKILPKDSRASFSVAAFLVGGHALLETVAHAMECNYIPSDSVLLSLFVMLQLLISLSVCVVLGFACDVKKLGNVSTIIWIIYAVFLAVAGPLGKVFIITDDGRFLQGSMYHVVYVFGAVGLIISITLLNRLGMKHKNKDTATLGLIVLNILFGLVVPYLINDDGIICLSMAVMVTLFYSYYNGMYFQEMREDIDRKNDELARASLKTVQALAGAVDAKDHYTRGHSWRVAEYSALIAKEMGFDGAQIEKIRCEALMHDVGKIGIPDSVLNKGQGLSDIEYGMIKLHTTLGSEIISKIGSDKDTFSAARSHHERYDGKGYPDHLKGEEIPLNARIICVADTYDAMNSDRIYRKAMPKEAIRNEMIKGRGTQFDPAILDIFVRLFDEGEMNRIDAHARRDSVVSQTDELTALLKDFLEFFEVKKEYTGEWEVEVKKVRDVYHYLSKMAGNEETYELSLINITTKEGITVSPERQQEAVQVMLNALTNTTDEKVVCAQISQRQVVCLLPKSKGLNTDDVMENVFLYYYKIIEVADFAITYEVISE